MSDSEDDAPTPRGLWRAAADDAADFSNQLSLSASLRFPWPSVDKLVGTALLPGWLVLVGGRAKAGKSTIMRTLFQAWTELSKRCLYVGTEQGAHILRMLWAAAALQVEARAAIDPTHPDHFRLLGDIAGRQAELAETAIIVAEQDLTMARFGYWCRFAKQERCDAVLLDHFHRVNGHTGSHNRYVDRGDDVRTIKNLAEDNRFLVVAAAQMRQGDGGQLLGEYEVPGPGSWAETAGLRREADVAIQAWRPFLPGVKAKDKAAARDNPKLISTIIHRNVMGIRVDAHRYNQEADGTGWTRLRVVGGELLPFLTVEDGGQAETPETEGTTDA